MSPVRSIALSLVLLLLGGAFGQALAQQSKPPNPALPPQSQPQTPLPTLNIVVSDRDRNAVLSFYRDEIAAGRCPAPMVVSNKACVAPEKRPWKLDQAIAAHDKLHAPPGPLGLKVPAAPTR